MDSKTKRLTLEAMTDKDLLNFFLDYANDMAAAFNGSPFPSEYPRFRGKAPVCGYNDVEKAVKSRGLYPKDWR